MSRIARHRPRPARGFALIEVLVAILVFSFGVLGMMGLQAVAIKESSQAQYRVVAEMQANSIISQMWADSHTPSSLQTNYASSGSGTAFSTWSSQVQASGLPGVSSANSTLPTIAVSSISGASGSTASSLVVVTVFWQAPNDTSAHQFVAIAQLK